MDSKQRIWDSLRNDARQADNLIERKLAALEDIARRVDDETSGVSFGAKGTASTTGFNQYNNPSSSSSTTFGNTAVVHFPSESHVRSVQLEFGHSQSEVEVVLQRFETLLETMAETARELPLESAAMTHMERFQQLAAEKRRTLFRVAADFKRRCERVELLPNISRELDVHREDVGTQLLLKEQESLRHTQRMLNNIIDRGEQAHLQLREQRDTFSSVSDRLLEITQRVPFVKNVLNRIDSRRRREAVIVGALIGLCMTIFVLFLF
ncbi:Golgi SNAP receptor complex member 1 [Trypanosoma brucei equiperdum]|uniref:Golgi SNAP receptor complex member 1 n=1 Tax=Trypanosoma brucei equiperdum TaxID=630700 RepID=A0A3L6KTJ0_9TRYP|nr:Golgi SNAP receptor complex member 1 [Trypanosoma brucei equiperdum]